MADEENIREVVVDVEEIVVESRILFRVEHLEQGRHGVTVVSGLCHFVYLVEDKDRVA